MLLWWCALCVAVAVAVPWHRRADVGLAHSAQRRAHGLASSADFPATAGPLLGPGAGTRASQVLFAHNFTSYDSVPITYTRPASLGLHVSKIVFTLACSLNPGRQFDRSVFVVLQGALLFAGTTAEPNAHAPGPHWVAQADLTPLAALFVNAASLDGYVQLGTIVNSVYNSVPFCSGTLDMYSGAAPPPYAVADLVVPLGFAGATLNAAVPAVPKARALFATLFAQGQYDDEFFWSCVPDSVAAPLGGQCNGTASRFVSLAIDGQLVAAFPPFPYIFTGGIDPLLWRPIVSVSTLHLLPVTVDLTPFVSLFHGAARNVTLAVAVTPNSFWNLAATLMFFTDSAVVGGSTDRNTLSEDMLNPVVDLSGLAINGSVVNGTFTVTTTVDAIQSGTVAYANGTIVTTALRLSASLSNAQSWRIPNASYTASTVTHSCAYRVSGTTGAPAQPFEEHAAFPLVVTQVTSALPHGLLNMTTAVRVGYTLQRQRAGHESRIDTRVFAVDSLQAIASNFTIVSNSGQSSSTAYGYRDNAGNCFMRELRTSLNALNGLLHLVALALVLLPLAAAHSLVVERGGRVNVTMRGPQQCVSRGRTLPTGGKDNCTACSNGSQCCGDAACCSGGVFCCDHTTEVCCNDTCCTTDESCCPDTVHGSVCCLTETSFCCPQTTLKPSHCCPHWSVCCPGGRYGCCDPGNLRAVENNFAYALFTKATPEGGNPLSILQIDLSTGKKTEVVTSFNDFGETARSWAWAAQTSTFYLPQTDYLHADRNVTLFVIDARAGHLSSALLQGVHGDVTGFCWAGSSITLATYGPHKSSYLFYSVDVRTGTAKLLGTQSFQQDTYSGWFKRCINATTLVRMGFRDVVNERTFGVALTTLQNASETTTFQPVLAPPGYADQFATVDVLNATTFLSLCPYSSTAGEYGVCAYGPTTSSARLLASLGNAHETDFFGPVSSAINSERTQYGAITLARSLLGTKFDRWGLNLLSLVTNKVVSHDLTPWMVGETDNVAGMGFPQ